MSAPTLSFLNWPTSGFPAQSDVHKFPYLVLGHFPSFSHIHATVPEPLSWEGKEMGDTGQTKGAADCQQSYPSCVPWTLPLGYGGTTQVLVTFHSLCWGLQLMENLEYLQIKKRVGKMKGAPCSAPRGSPGDEGQLPTAPGRALGLAAGRRRDRMTDFNLIRHKGHWRGALPRSPLSPAFSISAAAAPGPGTDGQQSTVQRAGRARLCLCLQHSQPDKGQTVPGKGNDPLCDGAQPGTGGSAPERRQQRRGERRSSSGAGSAASPPEQSRASDRAPVLVTSHPGSPERLLCSCSRARLTANVGA